MTNSLSIIIPTLNEAENIAPLLKRIDTSMRQAQLHYEAIIVDDHSTDTTRSVVTKLQRYYPVSWYSKRGHLGKAQSIIEGINYAKHDIVVMIDADLQYPPEVVGDMAQAILANEADIVVANRAQFEAGLARKIISTCFRVVFAKLVMRLDCDVQSGLKAFRKTIIKRVNLNPSPWAFDLEFLSQARDAGYQIATLDIMFAKRVGGKTKLNLVKQSFEIGHSALKLALQPKKPIAIDIKDNKLLKGFHYKGQHYITYSTLPPQLSALYRLTLEQITTILLFTVLMQVLFLIDWRGAVIVLLGGITLFYFADFVFSFWLVAKTISVNQKRQSKTGTTLPNEALPPYTILCPLYKEAQVLPQFIDAMQKLQYPKDKLQIMLLLEQDDTETIQQAYAMQLPRQFSIVVVPHSLPKTKPKACNYGLTKAQGKYVVIYDAEDIPDPLQLRKAVAAFTNTNDSLACVQAKLNYYNTKQNLLTRLFTLEYLVWFNLILPGLQLINAPIPLGGTSNHFNVAMLRFVAGWDAFNVTEDCDLGLRLAKLGYKTAIIDSVTLEEANSKPKNWLAQRTRWIKGYMQSYLVHMRTPKQYFTKKHIGSFGAFQLVVGGKVICLFINPLMWTLTIAYFALRPIVGPTIESFYPTPVLYLAVSSLVFGNFFYFYIYLVAAMQKRQYDIVEFAFALPFYWLAISLAGVIAGYQLVFKPHYWSKTVHGLHLNHKRNFALEAALLNKQNDEAFLIPTA